MLFSLTATLKQMYSVLVRSHLDYCDVTFHIPSKIHPLPLGMSLHDHMEKLERVQYQAALAVTGAWQGTSRIKLYEELGWESLSDRRTCRRVLQIHKIVDAKTPEYLQHCLPPNRNVIINLPLIFQNSKVVLIVILAVFSLMLCLFGIILLLIFRTYQLSYA